MKTILYVAAIFFCQDNNCAVISKGIPYSNLTECKTEVDKKVDELKKQGLLTVEGRCIDVEFRKYL